MRDAIAAMPDGVYRAALDLDGTGEEEVHLEVTIEIRGEEMFLDYAGTSPRGRARPQHGDELHRGLFLLPVEMRARSGNAAQRGHLPHDHVKAPEGSILNPRFPAPVHARQLVGHCLAAVVYKALSPILGERIIAESGSAPTLRVIVSGYREDERRYTSILFINGGMGARSMSDGLSATCFPSNVVCGSMEMIEAQSPLRIWRKELAPDSGGPGRFRGGLGQDVEIELTGTQAWDALPPRRARAPSRARRARRPRRRALARPMERQGERLSAQGQQPDRAAATGSSFAIPAAAVTAIRASAIAKRCARMPRPASSPRAPRRRSTAYDTLSRGRRCRRHLHRPRAL